MSPAKSPIISGFFAAQSRRREPSISCPNWQKGRPVRAGPSAICFFMLINGERAGIATCFINFSTFKIKPYLYIHDFFIKNSFRGKGLSSKFLSYLIYYSKEHDYCKVTLEVRSDNEVAKHVYNEMGFKDCEPPMYFWTKYIE